jgi:hypothetical protein
MAMIMAMAMAIIRLGEKVIHEIVHAPIHALLLVAADLYLIARAESALQVLAAAQTPQSAGHHYADAGAERLTLLTLWETGIHIHIHIDIYIFIK